MLLQSGTARLIGPGPSRLIQDFLAFSGKQFSLARAGSDRINPARADFCSWIGPGQKIDGPGRDPSAAGDSVLHVALKLPWCICISSSALTGTGFYPHTCWVSSVVSSFSCKYHLIHSYAYMAYMVPHPVVSLNSGKRLPGKGTGRPMVYVRTAKTYFFVFVFMLMISNFLYLMGLWILKKVFAAPTCRANDRHADAGVCNII